MKKISLITLALIILCTLTIFAQQIVLTVSDFKVESNNPSYEFIGKGISRLVAGELRKSDKIILLEREEVKRILEEQEFSLSDLADESKQIQIGKFLSAEYIVFGEIIDMGNTLLLSLRMADVETGEILWQEEITEKLETYDYIGAYFAKSIITELGEEIEETIEVEETTVAKIENKEEKKQEAIVKISEGIDAFDRDDFDTAKEVLEEAKELDPVNEVADYYLAKFVVNTTKFNVLTPLYYNDRNPAYLGIIRTDKIFFSNCGNYFNFPAMLGATINYFTSLYIQEKDVTLGENDASVNLGYSFPVGDNLGFSIEGLFSSSYNSAVEGDKFYIFSPPGSIPFADNHRWILGGIVSAGIKIFDSLAVGLGVSIYAQTQDAFITNFLKFGFNAGILYRNIDESFIFDTRIGYGNGDEGIINIDTFDEADEKSVNLPIFNENTFTFAFNKKNTFFILKQINYICIDRIYYYGNILPAIENFFADWFSLRVGLEGSYALLNDTHNLGFGILSGITLRSGDFDIDINVSYRLRPSRMVEELLYPDFNVLIILTWNDVFISR